MSSKNVDTIVNTPITESPERLSSPALKPKKTSPKSAKEVVPNLSENGSEDMKSLSSSELEKEPSSKSKKSGMPVPKLSLKQDRTLQALKRLGVKEDRLTNVPPLSQMIKEDAAGIGGMKAVLNALRFAGDDADVATFLNKYDSIPAGDRERLPWEAIAIAAELNVNHLLGAIHAAVHKYSVGRVKLIATLGHPLITKARIKYGQLPSGDKDRSAIDLALGFTPSPKGPTFIGKAVFGGASQTAAGDKDDDDDTPAEGVYVDEGDLDNLFPPSSAMQDKLIPIRQKLLE